MKVGTVLWALVVVPGVASATPVVPASEIKQAEPIKLPPVPDFALAPATGDTHDPKELRVRGSAYFGKDVQATGYVIWIYDCIGAVRKRGESRAEAQKRIDDDPTLCERPKLYLGTDRSTPLEKGLWVVDVPRPPNKLELERLPQEKLDAWPQVPAIHVGDHVTITGHFATESPHKERNSDGLLVFQSVAPAARATSAKPIAMPLQAGPPPAAPQPLPEVPVKDRAAHDKSILELNEANKLLGMKQQKEALEHYAKAQQLDPQNGLAAYGEGLARIELKQFAQAAAALERCAALGPEQPMYQMWAGIAAYEAKLDEARTQQAKARGVAPESFVPDLGEVDFSTARQHLELSVVLEPTLWRAHYYLGKIWRAGGAARDAAGELTKAIATNPHEWGPYVALAELYRKWDYTDAAIAVADAGSRNASEGISDLFYVLGMAYDDKHDAKKAIDAFSLSLAARASNAKALFQRGQVYFRAKQVAKAKADLEAFLAASGPSLEFARAEANKMLSEMP